MTIEGFDHILGALAALTSAFCWAVSALLFGRLSHALSAISINWFKGLVAMACLMALVVPLSISQISLPQWAYLVLSGLLGITLGDTLYFLTLRRLGSRLTLLLSNLIPLVTAAGAAWIFRESLNTPAILGLTITFVSVFYVLWSKAERHRSAGFHLRGVLLGIVFISTESSAILLTKAAVLELDSLVVTFLRQTVGVLGITFWLLSQNKLLASLRELRQQREKSVILLVAAVVGGFLGTWLSV